jgi:hypothetical protein
MALIHNAAEMVTNAFQMREGSKTFFAESDFSPIVHRSEIVVAQKCS